MKFKFKIQQYQSDAVEAVVRVFAGQGLHDSVSYIRDLGKQKSGVQLHLDMFDDDAAGDSGYKNEEIYLTDDQLLSNIQQLQNENNIKQSTKLVTDLGRCSLDVEMETGTGKTYVYTKTIFELNKRYGFTKFIIVVPFQHRKNGVQLFRHRQYHLS